MQMGDGPMMSGNYVVKVTDDAREEEMEKNVTEVIFSMTLYHDI